ncbi:MAG: hypothetical protein ACYSWQ_16230 [Planctomycetota bacterium]|jgi:hypothetical protein
MLKRTLIAVTVVALLATAAQAYGPDPDTGKQGDHTGIKVDPIKMDIFWPFVEYKALDLCVIPVKMEIGVFVQIEKCHDRKIILKQVECGDIGKNAQGDWPCYKGCETIKVRSNFDVKLGLKLNKVGPVIDKWSAEFTGGDTVDGGTGWNSLEICVKAWKAKLYEQEVLGKAGEKFDVGTVTVTVKPNV